MTGREILLVQNNTGQSKENYVMLLKDLLDEYEFVAKVEVSNLDVSFKWYQNLGLIHDPCYDTHEWRQFRLPDVSRVFIGLFAVKHPGGTGAGVSTFVVNDIVTARERLLAQQIAVSSISDVGLGVKLCHFKDPDGNELGLRQNPPEHPRVADME